MIRKTRPIGINQVAIEVGDIRRALDLYQGFLDFEASFQNDKAAFVYFRDQVINFMASRRRGRGWRVRPAMRPGGWPSIPFL